MKEKRICLVIPSLKAGGMEKVMIELASYFADNSQVEVHLVILGRADKFYCVPAKVIPHEPDFIFTNKRRLYDTVRTIYFLRKNIKKIKPSAVMSFGEMYNSFVLLGTFCIKTNVFVSDRSRPDKRWSYCHEVLRKLLYPSAAGIIAQTEYAKKFLSKEVRNQNIIVIPNPIRFNYSESIEKQNVILFVGRLISTKRVDLLLEIFSRVKFNDWKLWIVGDGPKKKELEILTSSQGLSNYVTFWGSQKEIEMFYKSSKIFAFPSVSEGFPNSLLEAMSAGLACIAFDCIAGPSELIIDGINGFLVPELDVQAFQNRLETLISDENLRLRFSINAINYSKKYSIESIGEQYLNLLLS